MKRDLRLDGLRGFFLLSMLNNHVNSRLKFLSEAPVGFAFAAEGFVFLAGYVVGLVYTRAATKLGRAALYRKAWHRAWVIYLFHIGVFALMWCLAQLSPILTQSWRAEGVLVQMMEAPVSALLMGVTLLYQPVYLNILSMYFVFLLLTPVAVDFLMRGRDKLVLGSSAAVWALAQVNWYFGWVQWELSYFNVLAWQAVFVGSLWFGVRRAQGRSTGVHFGPTMLLPIGGIAVGLLLLRYIFMGYNGGFLPLDPLFRWSGYTFGEVVVGLTDKGQMAPLRVLNIFAVAYVLAWLLQMQNPRLNALFSLRWLVYLGQHSLQVYAFHVPLVFLLIPLRQWLAPLGWPGDLLYVVATLLAAASLTLPAWLHVRYRARKVQAVNG